MAAISGAKGGSGLSDALQQLCREHILAARGWGLGEVYRRLRLGNRWYESFDLVWDAPRRIVVVAYCWTPESLRQLREDMRHLHVTLPQLEVYKKLHLILFHADTANASEQPFPSGVSFSPIALDPAKDLANPPPFVGPKLDSILGIPPGALANREVAVHGSPPPDWRLFLQNDRDIVVQKIRDIADANADLPDNLQTIVDQLLTMAEADPLDLQDQVTNFLNRLWEAHEHASATSAP